MITIKRSPTADSRTCDHSKVTKEELIQSSYTHISDVDKALTLFVEKMMTAGMYHDCDKLGKIDSFHRNFVTGFEKQDWLYNHYENTRHHLNRESAIPKDVNLIDVLEYIADCVMAGMARSGTVYDLTLSNELLQKAFQNTVKLLKEQVVVEGVNE